MHRVVRVAMLLAFLAGGPASLASCGAEASGHEERQLEGAQSKAEEAVGNSQTEKAKEEAEGANLEGGG